MPLRNEHVARQKPPAHFKSCGSVTIASRGRLIRLIVCSPTGRKSARDTTVQSVRFPVDYWTPGEAKGWLKKNGFSTALFEPAMRQNPDDEDDGDEVLVLSGADAAMLERMAALMPSTDDQELLQMMARRLAQKAK